MSPQITEQITPTPPATSLPRSAVPPSKMSLWARVATRRNVFWLLVAVGVMLNATIVYCGYTLWSEPASVEPTDQKPLDVPFAGDKALLDGWRRWPVQDGGRIKPFDSFCRETVRIITGREKFQGNDPVAVALSWIMLHRPATPDTKLHYRKFDYLSRQTRDNFQPQPWTVAYEREADAVANSPDAKRIGELAEKAGCDWEEYPFILCDYHELREKILRERHGDNKKLELEELHGKYMSPNMLRHSAVLKTLVAEAQAERRKDPEKAKLTMLQSKAIDVDKRLRLYDRTRSMREFGVAALDAYGPEWFRLDHLRYFFVAPPLDSDGVSDQLGLLAGGIPGTLATQAMYAERIWEHWQKDTRTQHGYRYEGKPQQPFPREQSRRIVAAFEATQDAYLSALEAKDTTRFADASAKFFETVDRASNEVSEYPTTTAIDLELTFNRAVPFRSAWIFGLAAALVLALCLVVGGTQGSLLARGLYGLGMLGYATAVGFAIYGFYCRITVSGRPPVGNMYESIIWVAFMTAIFGLALELIYRRGVIALAGALVSTFGFVLADQLPTTFSPAIEPLNAVLRSNYWLLIHVLTIVSSYAALALAWGLGNINIALILFSPGRGELIRRLSHYSYKAIQIGVVLLFLGTMLGGFWAAESWGRFWGWDAKEVWALIAFLCYIIPLHARYVGWIKDFGLAACSVVCFSAVVMAWYGVNFILGTGLHFYGFGSGNNGWIYFGALTNISLVVHAGLRYMAQGGHRAVAA